MHVQNKSIQNHEETGIKIRDDKFIWVVNILTGRKEFQTESFRCLQTRSAATLYRLEHANLPGFNKKKHSDYLN